MSDRLLKESDVMRIAFQLPYVVNSAFFDAVKALPSVDRPIGKWIDSRDTDTPWNDGFKCSACNKNSLIKYKFCPSCGAKMKGVDNE